MKRMISIGLISLSAACIAAAQQRASAADVLGAHANYGHACGACHLPHTTMVRDGVHNTANEGARHAMLWGEDGGGIFLARIGENPEAARRTPEVAGLLVCLSCHDGNYAPAAMIKNTMYETLPETYGTIDSLPTLIDRPQSKDGPSLSDHPAGAKARMGCGGASEWDCTERNGVISMRGPRSSKFAENYGFFIRQHNEGDTPVVVCSTCHNPHSMTRAGVSKASASVLFPAGTYTTRHFLRAPYGDGSASRTSNLYGQFCRQCHAGMSNEMNGSALGTIL